MSAPPLLCAGLEVILNRYLALDPEVLADCGRLNGKVIALHVPSPTWSFYIELTPQGTRVLGALDSADRAPDVAVAGPLATLLRLGFQASQGEAGIPQGLTIQGDAELLTRFNQLLARVGFDPEEFAAKFLGDVGAHRLTGAVKSLFGWSRKTVQTLGLDTAEYLREETRDLARGVDVSEWMDSIDQLRDAVDRFEARLARAEDAPR